jgi:hypothetical protein
MKKKLSTLVEANPEFTTRKITWTAYNNSTFLDGEERARTVRGAIRAAKQYADGELFGEGTIIISADGVVIRRLEAGLLAGTQRFHWIDRDI